MSISIANKTRGSIPRVQFEKIKNQVLGNSYELSLVFIGPAVSKRLNRTYRGKNRETNVLSFPISKNSGEVFIDTSTARKELKKFDMAFPKFIAFLFIHALLHLKGMAHGDTMEKTEQKILNGANKRSWY